MAASQGKDSSVDPDPTIECINPTGDKNSLLHEAAKKGQLDKMRRLIKEEHCDPMYQDENGWTAILYATYYGRLEIVQFLCDECGVNPKLYEQEYYTTLPHLAAKNGHLDVLKLWLKLASSPGPSRIERGLGTRLG